MAWKTPETNSISLQKKPAGTHYEGTYQGSRIVPTALGETTLYNFQDSEGKPFSIWGFSHLNFQMQGVGAGAKCRITYLGPAPKKNKFGKFPHQSKVEIWEGEGTEAEEIPF